MSKQEFKVVGKIDLASLEKFNKPKRGMTEKVSGFDEYQNILDEKLGIMAQEINGHYGDFVSADGSISMDSYPEDFFDRRRADEYIKKLEDIFITQSGQNRETWEREREKKAGIVAEKVLVLLFHKMMGKADNGFVTVRASRYDDYHGIDTVIIDKETGNPICGFDEMSADEDDSLRQKGSKIYNQIVSYDGALIQYGAIIKDGKLQKRTLKNVPAFYLAISKKELEEVLPNLAGEDVSAQEIKIFQSLVSSLEQQLKNIYREYDGEYNELRLIRNRLLKELEELKESQPGISLSQTEAGRDWKKAMGENNLKMNIANFKKSLAKMKKLAGIE